MNHKISTYTIIGLIVLSTVAFVIGISSGDVDELCKANNSSLYRENGEWKCLALGNPFNESKVININSTCQINVTNGIIMTYSGGC